MDKVAIYCRLSDEDEDKKNIDDDSESIQNQKNLLMKYSIEKGWDIYKIYSDDDYSGLDKDRPEFNIMIQDAENKKFDIILCKHQSRFTRDMELVEGFLHNKFIEWGIRFVTVVDGADTSDKHNKKSRQINGLVNEWYCEDVSESIKATFKTKRESGEFIGSFASYGYTKDPNNKNKLIIDEEAAEVIRQIYNWYLEGYGTQHIAYKLNEKQIPNPTTYKQKKGLKYINSSGKNGYGLWNKTTVKRILKSEIYIGNMVQHKLEKINYKSKKVVNLNQEEWIIVKNTHQPIIDEEIYNNVQNRLSSNIRSTGLGMAHLFAGKVRCLDCGSTLNKTTNQTGTMYLRCKLFATQPKKQLCSNHTIRLDELKDYVTVRLREYLYSMCNENNINNKLMQEKNIEDKLKSLEKEYRKIISDIEDRSNALKNIYIDKVKGIIDENQFKEFNCIFAEEKRILLLKQKEYELSIDKIKSKTNDTQKYLTVIKENKDFTELTHSIINRFVDYIEVGQKDKQSGNQFINIHWNF